jgi:hypothetical protein
VASCAKSVAESNKDMQAVTWMLTTAYICTLTDASGCKAMASAVEIPFASSGELRNAFERAAADVQACAAGAASSGRRLEGWGMQYTSDHPDVDVATLENICRNAAQLAQSGETLPELQSIGWVSKTAAVFSGIANTVLGLVVKMKAAAYVKDPINQKALSFWVGVGFDESLKEFIWEPFFFGKNIEDCGVLYGEHSCGEFASAGASPAVAQTPARPAAATR